MSNAIQVWAPRATLSPSDRVFRQDIQRAEQQWSGELRVWLCPEVDSVVRWTRDDGTRECVVPARRPERIDIYTIDRKRRVHPRLPVAAWYRGLPKALYRDWLNKSVKTAPFPNQVRLNWPVITNGKFGGYQERTFTTEPPPHVPVASFERDRGEMKFDWEWRDVPGPRPVSPETESKDVWGIPRRIVDTNGEEIALVLDGSGNEQKAAMIECRWEKPYETLLPSAGLDTVAFRDAMGSCIRTIREGDPAVAIQKAQMITALFASDTALPKFTVDVLPAFASAISQRDRDGLLMEMEENFDIEASTVEEVLSEARRSMRQPVPATRLLTWMGYFWWEFTRDITEYRFVGFCQRCGSVIAGGHTDRQCCRRDENPECYRSRDAHRKRRSRTVSDTRRRD